MQFAVEEMGTFYQVFMSALEIFPFN